MTMHATADRPSTWKDLVTSPKFNSQISLGNVLQIAALIVAVAAGWQAIDNRTRSNAEAIVATRAEQERRSAELAGQIASHEGRIRAVEQSSIRSDERLQNILSLLGRIDARLERIEGGDR